MPPLATAQIIAFPTRAGGGAGTNCDKERLARAIASLDAALAEQRTTMVGWRDSLDNLRKATGTLGLSLQRYQRTLGKLGTEVTDLQAQAVRLENWADNAGAAEAAPTKRPA